MRELTEDERKWLASLRRLAQKQPESLSLLTTGDRYLIVLDEAAVKADGNPDLHDGAHEPFDLATIYFKNPIHGVSG